MTAVLTARHVAKSYRRSDGGSRSLRNVTGLLRADTYWALQDVSFVIEEGESVGLIGINGSGKSTLLRVLSGLTSPTRGEVVLGKPISGLLTLGDSFQLEQSARENALTGAILAGLSRRQAQARLDDIAAFAELEDVMHLPLRTFSDGMRLRLAFAVSMSIDPQVLLIDEVLAVGDLRFREKCLTRLQDLQRQGVTIVISTHEVAQVESLCQRALWLADGRIKAEGEATHVVRAYQEDISRKLAGMTRVEEDILRVGDAQVEISSVTCNGVPMGGVEVGLAIGQPLELEISYVAHADVGHPFFGVSAHDEHGEKVFDVNSGHAGLQISVKQGPGKVVLQLGRLDLQPGSYKLDVGIYSQDWDHPHDYHWAAYPFRLDGPGSEGTLNPPSHWSIGS